MLNVSCTLRLNGDGFSFVVPEACSAFSLGGSSCDIVVPGLDAEVSVFCERTEGFRLHGAKDIILSDGSHTGKELELTGACTVSVSANSQDTGLRLSFAVSPADEVQPLDRMIELSGSEIRVGKGRDCEISFPAAELCDEVLTLHPDHDSLSVSVVSSRDLVLRNSELLLPGAPLTLNDGDFLFFGKCALYYSDNALYTVSSCRVSRMYYRDRTEQNSHLDYPQMSRTTRAHIALPSESVDIQDPPAKAETPPQRLIITLLPVLLMVGLMLLLRGSSGAGSMLFSVFSIGIGGVTSVLTFFQGKKETKKKNTDRVESYTAYIARQREKIEKLRVEELKARNEVYFSPARELALVRDFSPDLFDRTVTDQDFLDLRIGYGRQRSLQPVKVNRRESINVLDELFHEPDKLMEEFNYVDNAPVVIRLREKNAIGFLGSKDSLRDAMNYVTLDLITRQFYENLHLYMLCEDHFDLQLNAYRFLPHLQNARTGQRNIANSHESVSRLMDDLYKLFSERESSDISLNEAPWLVVYMRVNEELMQHPLLKYVRKAWELHAVFIFWAEFREQLPIGCNCTVRLFGNGSRGLLSDMMKQGQEILYSYDPVSNGTMADIAGRLAPVYCQKTSLASRLPSAFTFFGMLSEGRMDPANILKNWSAADPTSSLSVPVGIVSDGSLISLDIHEKAHGPHGLIAGTTGSGKSEVMITYLLSLACNFSPDQVNFVIIDFKGGGMAKQLEGLPHLTGCITNLDGHEMARSLSSIRAELLRRQRLLASAGISNINDYWKALKKGRLSEPLPHLILVVDEFAELKSQQPEFMNELISTARIGRSLGVHMILATQKPHGVVNEQILSNTNFRLCLRVQTKEDSNEMIDSPLASEIREPGRGYLKVDRCELFRLFQSGYTGAPVSVATKDKAYRLNTVLLNGERQKLYEHLATRQSAGSDETQFAVTMAAIAEAYQQSGCETPQPLCLPPLPTEIHTNALEPSEDPFRITVGLSDEPAIQAQNPFSLPLTDQNTLIIGASQSGKTELLRSVLVEATRNLTSDQINFYIMDFNSGVFRTMSSLSAIGGVVGAEEEERVRNLLKLLRLEITERKNKLVSVNVTTFSAYRAAGYDDLPAIILMIDNFVIFRELYDEKYEDTIQYILREGPAVGVCSLVTAVQAMTVGFRRMCFFEGRVALYCADANEYSNFFDSGRRSMPEIPGRALVRVGKEIIETQIALAFGSDPLIPVSEESAAFVREHASGQKAKKIPEVPAILKYSDMAAMFRMETKPELVPFAMDFGQVEPVYLNLADQFSLSLIGKNRAGKSLFVRTLLSWLRHVSDTLPYRLHVVDHFERPLWPLLQEDPRVAKYSVDDADAAALLRQALKESEARYALLRESGSQALMQEPLDIYLFNSVDVVRSLSSDTKAMEALSEIESRYRRMRNLFIFADVENRAGGYGAPALLRFIKDQKQALLFESIDSIKTFEIDFHTAREHRTMLGQEDAFMLTENALIRIRLSREIDR